MKTDIVEKRATQTAQIDREFTVMELTAMLEQLHAKVNGMGLENVFRQFDIDEGGYIDLKELNQGLQSFG